MQRLSGLGTSMQHTVRLCDPVFRVNWRRDSQLRYRRLLLEMARQVPWEDIQYVCRIHPASCAPYWLLLVFLFVAQPDGREWPPATGHLLSLILFISGRISLSYRLQRISQSLLLVLPRLFLFRSWSSWPRIRVLQQDVSQARTPRAATQMDMPYLTHSLVQVLPGPEELGLELDGKDHTSNLLRLFARLQDFGDISILYPLDPNCRIAGYGDTRSYIHLGYVKELKGAYLRAMPCKYHTRSSLGVKSSRVVKMESLANFLVHQEPEIELKSSIAFQMAKFRTESPKWKNKLESVSWYFKLEILSLLPKCHVTDEHAGSTTLIGWLIITGANSGIMCL